MSQNATPTSTAEDADPAAPGEQTAPPFRYTAALATRIERSWQDRWADNHTFETPNPSGPLAASGDGAGVPAEKMYILDMFPYPSGAGLHVGHPLGYIGTDVLGRFWRMNGRNVLHTIGYDAFGLPAEQYAVRTGTHPRATTEENVARYREQLRKLGFAHDQRRSIATTDVSFYRWTQWIFLRLFDAWYDTVAKRARHIDDLIGEYAAGTRSVPGGSTWNQLDVPAQQRILADSRLAYISEAPVNWCPGLGTVLSNEEVTTDGRSEIGNYPVFRRNLRQWKMRITAYADRLVEDLDRLDWPESVKAMQRNWIGRSVGAQVGFDVVSTVSESSIEVYTTRPDTLFGATYMVLAPEHPLVPSITAMDWPTGVDPRWTGGADTPTEAIEQYRSSTSRKSDLDRQESKDKTGVFTGAYARNPVNGNEIPVFIADYVLMGYGTGAIMAVPGQDTRDWDFATAFGLPVIRTVQPAADHPGDQAFTGNGPAINSANAEIDLNGLDIAAAKATMIDWLEAKGLGRPQVQYKLRDWLFSRQRYWGEPFPIVYSTEPGREDIAIALPDELLPVELPDVIDYAPKSFDPMDADSSPEPPLGRATEWATVTLDLGDGPREYRRELNVMPQWAGSCWYELRYLDPTNTKRFVDPDVEKYWMGKDPARPDDTGGVDLYVGGVEHAVLHLLYSRFWHKVLFDLGEVSSEEPFRRLFNQGYIQAFAYTDDRGFYVPAEDVVQTGETFTYHGNPVNREYGKMGKSLNNVVTPDEMCVRYGADTFRMYEMGMGPLDISRPWQTADAVGSQRYLQRLWRNIIDEATGELVVVDDEPDRETLTLMHRTVDGVRADLAAMQYNTAIAKLIVLNSHVTKSVATTGRRTPRLVAENLVLMTAPLAPHIAEELWERLGHNEFLAYGPFPEADAAYLVDDTVEYPIQMKGKVRGRITVPADAAAADIEAAALAEPKIVEALAGAVPKKVVVVPGRMVSIVV